MQRMLAEGSVPCVLAPWAVLSEQFYSGRCQPADLAFANDVHCLVARDRAQRSLW
jgi:hypothetical protein